MVGRAQLSIPAGTGKVSGGGIDDAVPPMNSEHPLATEILCPPHVGLKTTGAKLGKPYRGIVLKPGNGPALPASHLAEGLMNRVPSERGAYRGEDSVFR